MSDYRDKKELVRQATMSNQAMDNEAKKRKLAQLKFELKHSPSSLNKDDREFLKENGVKITDSLDAISDSLRRVADGVDKLERRARADAEGEWRIVPTGKGKFYVDNGVKAIGPLDSREEAEKMLEHMKKKFEKK